MKFILAFIALVLICSYVDGAVYKKDLYITKQIVNFLNPASPARGNQVPKHLQREAYLLNNQYPGPLIRVKQNDVITVRAFNKLNNDSIALHWHGQRQFHSPWADGAAKINQCPVNPGHSYLYNFTAADYGTYWYHGHLINLYARGIVAPLIVEEPHDPYRHMYSEEIVIITNDWYRNPAGVYKQYNDTNNNALLAKPDKNVTQKALSIDLGLINGQWGNGTEEYPYPTYDMETGKCYRIRQINANSDSVGIITYISDHSINAIAYKAVNVEPKQFGVVYTYNSERFDGIVCASKKEGDYKVHFVNTFAISSGLANATNNVTHAPICLKKGDPNCFYGVLRIRHQKQYGSKGVVDRGQIIDKAPLFNDSILNTPDNLDSVVMKKGGQNPSPKDFPTYTNGTLEMLMGIKYMNLSWFLWQTQSSFQDPQVPLLQSGLQYGLGNQTYHYQVPLNSVYDIVIDTLANNGHPVHLHGYRFWILGQGTKKGVNITQFTVDRCNNTYDFETSDDPKLLTNFNALNQLSGCKYDPAKDDSKLNLKNPFYADTIEVPSKTWVKLRVKFDNPGPWLMHCHVQNHQNFGLDTVIVVGDPQKDWPKIPSYVPRC